MKVLVVRFSSIGDIVLTTPVVRALKVGLEDAQVHYCTKAQYRGLVDNNPYIDKVHVLDGDMKPLLSALKAEQYDFIVDLHNNLRTRQMKWALRRPMGHFPKLNWQKWLLVNLKIDKLPRTHIVERYMQAAQKLNIKLDRLGLDYFIPEKDEVPLSWLPPSHQKGYVAVAIGAAHPTKQLPLNRLIELCDRINKPIVLLGGPAEKALGDQVVEFFTRSDASAPYEEVLQTKLQKKALVFNACGELNLNQSASLIKKANHVFAPDTGLMHIAAALRRPLYTIWGSTTPLFGMYPYNTKFTVFENNKLNCRPCSKIGKKKCPKGHFKCMNEVTFDFYLP